MFYLYLIIVEFNSFLRFACIRYVLQVNTAN